MDCRVGFRKCPYCGYVNRIEVSRVVKVFKSAKEASELVKFLNEGNSEFKKVTRYGQKDRCIGLKLIV